MSLGTARREVRVETTVAADRAAVWRLIADHEGMPTWMPVREVVRRRPGAEDPDGVGAIRTIKSGGLAFDEEIVVFVPGERLVYRVLGGAPLREHLGEIEISPHGNGSRVAWNVGFRPWIPGTGFLVERQVRSLLDGAMQGLRRELGAA